MSKERNDDFNLLDIPYCDRQFIVVADDKFVKAAREAEKQEVAQNNKLDWLEIGKRVIKIMLPTSYILLESILEIYKAINRARESGVRILLVGKSEVKYIRFPIGHPREGILYVGHPADPNTYYTTAEFHRFTFEHKFCEAINILMSLGATELLVEHVCGWSKDFSTRISIPLSADFETGCESKFTSSLLFKATLPGTQKPQLPDNLIWFPHEPMWQSIAEGRIKFKLKNFSLTVNYEDDFGVNAGLKMSAKKAGLELGGKFEDHQSTIWRISGKFKEI